MKDYTDFYALSWQKSKPVIGFWRMLIGGVPYWILPTLLYSWIVYYFAYRQLSMDPKIILYSLLAGGFFFFWLLAFLWHMALKARGRTIVTYHIDREGIRIDDSLISFDELNATSIAQEIASQEQSNKAAMTIGKKMLIKNITLHFAGVENKQQVLKSLKQYLSI